MDIGEATLELPGTAALSVHWSPGGRRLAARTDAGATVVTAAAEPLSSTFRALRSSPPRSTPPASASRCSSTGRLQVWGPGGRELDVPAGPGLTSVAVAGAAVIGIGPDDLRFQLIGDLL